MKTLLKTTVLCISALTASDVRTVDDILIANFEGTNYGSWNVTGEAFGSGPAHGTLPGQMHVDGFKGEGLVNSFFKGDDSIGTLTSPEFKIEHKFISFLIGGGKHPEKLAMNLLLDGKAARNATGPNDKPGGSEALAPEVWDVSEFAGKTAVIQIVDQAAGGWGHINVDQIVQTDRKPPGLLANVTREMTLERRYLNLPIKNGGPKRQMSLLVDGQPPRNFEIELADAEPDWWAFMDIAPFMGKKATLKVDRLPEDSTGLKAIDQSDEIKNSENLYREKFHRSSTSPRAGAGTTTPTASSTTRASTISSINTTLTAGPGATCTGAMRSARI